MHLKGTLLALKLALGVAGAAGLLATSTPVWAQSAADKATARKLATAGIKLFQESEYDEALDKLKRAQALYDAPVHLLYIARCQVQLGKLVEGAESYRKLIRTELEPKAPDVFKAAISDGEQELAKLEPRIPALTINVEPSSVQGLQIKLDGEPVSAAILGVERPANPGERVVEAEAPGYLTAAASTTLAEGQSQQVSLTLEVDPNAPQEPPAEAAAAQQSTEGAPAAQPKEEDWREAEIEQSAVGFFVGLSVGGLFPTGNLQSDFSTADYMGTGGGGELHGGVRFLRNFGVKLYYERYALLPGPELDAPPSQLQENDQFEVTSTAYATSFGFSALAGTQRNRIGGYGELGLAIVHEYGWDREIVDTATGPEDLPNFDTCTETQAFRGPAFRVGGAFVFPVHPNVQLTVSAMVTLGNFSKAKFTSDCEITGPAPGESEAAIDKKGLHQQIFLGVGGDFVFGPG